MREVKQLLSTAFIRTKRRGVRHAAPSSGDPAGPRGAAIFSKLAVRSRRVEIQSILEAMQGEIAVLAQFLAEADKLAVRMSCQALSAASPDT